MSENVPERLRGAMWRGERIDELPRERLLELIDWLFRDQERQRGDAQRMLSTYSGILRAQIRNTTGPL